MKAIQKTAEIPNTTNSSHFGSKKKLCTDHTVQSLRSKIHSTMFFSAAEALFLEVNG